MPQNSDNNNDKKLSREQLRDDFWDLDMMLPRKAPQSAAEFASPADTETVEITFGGDDENLSEFAPSRSIEGLIPKAPPVPPHPPVPPAPNITNRAGRSEASRRARETLAARAHTPGDVHPQMSVPVCSYEPENSFLKQVSVFRWPTRYNYYERFTADAERYYNRTAAECPFANFFAYMPQYSAMSQDQLRWYLYWRDNVRHGNYLTTDYSYIFLYIYEIINLPEHVKPEDGVLLLCDLWLAYREKFPRLDRYMGEWVCDYCLVHGLPAPLEKLSPILPTLVDKLSFKEFFIRCDPESDCPFTASLCDLLSNYNWRQSKYSSGETRPLFEHYLYEAVLGALRTAWKESPDFSSLLGLNEVAQSRNAFSGALCTYNMKRRIDISYISLSRSYQLRFIISDLYKMAENCIRAHLGIKSRLSATGVPEPLKSYIKRYFEEMLPPPAKPVKTEAEKREARIRRAEEQRKKEEAAYAAYYEPLSSTLSPEDALKLEKTSWANTEMLVTEEDAEEPASVVSASSAPAEKPAAAEPSVSESKEEPPAEAEIPDSDDPYENFVNHLNPIYYQALKHIICLEQAEYSALCQSAMMLPDAMADAINELAVTYTDDTALEPDGTFFKLSDFYANEIMNAVVAREDS